MMGAGSFGGEGERCWRSLTLELKGNYRILRKEDGGKKVKEKKNPTKSNIILKIYYYIIILSNLLTHRP